MIADQLVQLLHHGPAMILMNTLSDKFWYLLTYIYESIYKMLIVQCSFPEGFYRKNQKMMEKLFKHVDENRLSIMSPDFVVSNMNDKHSDKNGGKSGGKKLELDQGSFLFKYNGSYFLAQTTIRDETINNYHIGTLETNYVKSLIISGFRWNSHKINELITEFNLMEDENSESDSETTLSDLMKNPNLAYDYDLIEKLEEETKRKESEGNSSGYYIIPDKMYTDSRWVRFCDLDYIDMDNVVLPETIKNKLMDDFVRFETDETKLFYRIRGINYKRSYLLHGKPGGGKSSFIRAFASKFKMNVYEVNCNSMDNMEALRLKLSEIPKRSIVLIEDIDIIFTSREFKKQEMADLSADEKYHALQSFDDVRYEMGFFFNILDGIVPVINNSILFLTTNHLDRLDPALTRPGRVDLTIEFPELTYETSKILYLGYFPKQEKDADEIGKIIETKKVMPTYLVEFLRENMFKQSKDVVEIAKDHFKEFTE